MSFVKLDGDTAILVDKGVWRTCDLYTLNGDLFAKWGSGFIRLRSDGSTSKDKVNFVELHTDRDMFADRHSRLTLRADPVFKPFQLEKKDDTK